MPAPSRKLVLYIATSIDGYIATHDDDLSFLSTVEQKGEDYGYNEFISQVDTVIVGRKTYEWVLKNAPAFGHKDKEVFVITHQPRPEEGNITFYGGDLKALVLTLKSQQGKTIFCDGGAQVVHELLREDLVDEIYISIVPVLLGSGKKLFSDGRPYQHLKLHSSSAFPAGLVQLHYTRR